MPGQYGEDKIILEFFKGPAVGTVVDVGAADPQDNSNSEVLLAKGWQGILIEPEPNQFAGLQKFYTHNPRVHCVNTAVGTPARSATFHRNKQVSTFLPEWRKRCEEKYNLIYIEMEMTIKPLTDILNDLGVEQVDFLSVDTEGMEVEVFASFDWKRWRPKLVCTEGGMGALPQYGYKLFTTTNGNRFFVPEEIKI
jgi:FkbM family methyltransferase